MKHTFAGLSPPPPSFAHTRMHIDFMVQREQGRQITKTWMPQHVINIKGVSILGSERLPPPQYTPSNLFPLCGFSGPSKSSFPLGDCDAVHVVAFQLPAGASYQQPACMCHAFFRSLHISAGRGQG